jgi:hypothetical protein
MSTTQHIGAQGIASLGVKLDWDPFRLVRRPPFEQFCQERHPSLAPADVVAAEDMVREYCDWFEASGRWPKESPFGGLK